MALHPDQFVERYPIRVRLMVIGVTLFVVSIFYIFPRFAKGGVGSATKFVDTVETIEIPPTEQMEIPPPPARPSIPMESEDDIPEDITIDETELDDFEWDAPPPPPNQGPSIPFIPYDDPPVPIGGQGALMRRVVYPDMAQEAGIEGVVIVHAFIDKKGRVTDTMILYGGIPNTGLNEAAVNAIKRTRWKPARQRDKIVAVWISVPIRFKLTR